MDSMTVNREKAEREILAKVVELAKFQGKDARALQPGQMIPKSGFLDSAGLMELMLWYETHFDLTIDQDDFTLENFGTVNAMLDYLERARGNA
jgi:D-alanine--poly(phosphoribitol) ligase subunit 2